jgi:hypothetical protein
MKRFLFVCACLGVLGFQSHSQELRCDVILNFEGIPGSQRDNLKNFEQEVERYLNSTRWTNEDYQGENEKINCSIQIYFTSASNEGHYVARVIVTSSRPVYNEDRLTERSTPVLRIVDERWEFDFNFTRSLFRDEFNFNSLTSFLDFYAMLIIGYDVDTYKDLQGTQVFQKAQNICNQAAGTGSSKEWNQPASSYSRNTLIDELFDLRLQPVRSASFTYHFDGLDMALADSKKALDAMLHVIEQLADLRDRLSPRSITIRTFFDTKYLEIAEQFLKYPDPSVWQRLSKADPTHANTYDEYSKKPR